MAEHNPSPTAKTLKDKTALVTGAARRIGAEIARQLHHAGMNLLLHYSTSAADAAQLAAELNALRPNSASLAQADLLAPQSYNSLVATCVQQWGRLDVLVNNASSFYPSPIGKIDEKSWNDLIGTNLKAPLFLAQAGESLLRESRGSIINIADIHGLKPLPTYSVYCAAKAGLINLTKALAYELGPDIRVNAVAPGHILNPEGKANNSGHDTGGIIETTALKRRGSPVDIARAVLFLVRDGEFISGEILTVDGGRY